MPSACGASSKSRINLPIRRFKSLAEMERTVWLDRDDPQLWPTIASVWALSARLCPVHFTPGLHKHRSIEEANRLTDAWEAATVRRQAG
jgi:hypothetical protein